MSDRTTSILAIIMLGASGAMLAPMIFGAPVNIVLVAGFVGATFGGFLARLFKDDFKK